MVQYNIMVYIWYILGIVVWFKVLESSVYSTMTHLSVFSNIFWSITWILSNIILFKPKYIFTTVFVHVDILEVKFVTLKCFLFSSWPSTTRSLHASTFSKSTDCIDSQKWHFSAQEAKNVWNYSPVKQLQQKNQKTTYA